MITKKIQLLFLPFLLGSSCSSSLKSTVTNRTIQFAQVEQIAIGQPKDQVIKLLGEPAKYDSLQIRQKFFESLEYTNSDEYKSQRMTILLEPKEKVVVSKTFIPNEDEPEHSIEYLKTAKYKSLKFVNFDRPQCKLHFPPSDAMWVNFDNGILIRHLKNDSAVLGISWMSKERLTDIIKSMNNCQK